MALPDGVVTFLFTDVEGSTRLWEDAPDVMMRALEQHDEVIDAAVEAHNGVAVKPRGEGDSRFIVFPAATDAVAAVAEMQAGLAHVDWATPRPVRVRMALHTGHAQLESGDYYGAAVNRAARLRAIAHGGQTVMSEATWQLVQEHLPDGVTVLDMGRHGLKDLTRPEHVYQINVDGLPLEFPPLKSLDAVPNNLPEQLTELIGRESDLEEVDRLLGQTRLLTILAPGGTGKTRLSIQAAADHTADFPDGVFFVPLADLSVGGDIVQAVATALGIALAADRDPKSQLLDYLTPRRALLVFDNFEHLSGSAGIATEILEAAPRTAIIATSRTRLNLTGETTLTLGGLDTSWGTPAEAMHTSGVQLFVDAAQRAQPTFTLQPEDDNPLAEIMELTGGMPLAILLAAAWANVLSVRDIATEVRKNIDFLESQAGDAVDRHRSVRAVFDYTWELLSAEERDVFAVLSVFRGGFTREAAESVAGAGIRDLAALAGKALVAPDPSSGRYRVHELLRQYAQQELEKDPKQSQSVTESHAAYYAELTETAFKNSLSDELGTVELLENDFDNIRLAWRHGIASHDAQLVRNMLGGMWFLTEVRTWYPAGVELFGDAVDGLGGVADDATTRIACAGSAALHSTYAALLGRQPDGMTQATWNAVDELRQLDDPMVTIVALIQLYVCLLYVGRFDEVVAVIDEIQTLGETVPIADWPTVPMYLAGEKNPRAMTAIVLGDMELGRRLLEESRRVLEPSGELYYLSWNLAHRARLALMEGRTSDAIELFSQSADCSRQLRFYRGLEYSLSMLGGVHFADGDIAAAEEAYFEAISAAERTSMVPPLLGGLRQIAAVFAATNRKTKAVELLGTVLADPASDSQVLSASAPTNELASALLEDLESEVDPGEFASAKAVGAAKPLAVAVKELLDIRTSTA